LKESFPLIRLPRVSAVLASAAALTLAGALPALAGTVGLWHMNELSGKMVDSSGAGNHGAVENIKRVSPGYTGSGRAYRFNGSSSRVVIDNEANLNPGVRSIRISARVKFSSRPSDAIGDYDLVRKGGGVYKMEILRSGQAFCDFNGTDGGLSLQAGPDLSDGRWHTIVCRKTSTGITLIVDGSSSSKGGSVGSISNRGPLILGGKPSSSGDWYDGNMDEVRIKIA